MKLFARRRTIKDVTKTNYGFSLPHNALRPHVRSTSALDAKRSMFDIHVAKSTIDYGQFYDGVPGGEENAHIHNKHLYSSDYDIGTLSGTSASNVAIKFPLFVRLGNCCESEMEKHDPLLRQSQMQFIVEYSGYCRSLICLKMIAT